MLGEMVWPHAGGKTCALLLVFLLLEGTLTPQCLGRAEPPQGGMQLPPTTTLRLHTRLVLVDVVVTDKKGHPVEGLGREDFTLEEDGQPQEIAFFSWEGRSQTSSAPPALPPNVYTNRPDYYRPPGTLTLILLDALNTPRKDQMLMREEMLRYFKSSASAGQWTAILLLTDQLTLLQDFTPNRELLLAAVKNYTPKQSSPLGLREQVLSRETDEEHAYIQEMSKWCGDPCRDLLAGLERFEETVMAESDQDRMRRTLEALRALGQAVAGYPGRKNLVWVSGSFPVFYRGDQTGRHRWSGDAEVRTTAELLNDARVAIYPVDPRGLVPGDKPESYEEFAARVGENRPPQGDISPIPQAGIPKATVPSRSPRHPQDYLYASQSTMKLLADTTGGRAFYNRNDIANAVELAVADGSSYYALGYYPRNEEWAGAFRRIELKLARNGLRLRYRQGYFAIPTATATPPADSGTDLQEELRAALEAPFPATGVIFRVHISQPELESTSPGGVAVEFWLEGSTLVLFHDAGGGGRLNVDCVVAAYSPDGRMVQSVGQRVDWHLQPGEFVQGATKGIAIPATIELPPGSYHLRLLVRDNNSGRLGRVDLPLNLPVTSAFPAAPSSSPQN